MSEGLILQSLADNDFSAQPKIFTLTRHLHGNGKVSVEEQFERVEQYSSYANTLWEGAIIAAGAINRCPSLACGRRILEIGAGLGLPGLCAAALGAAEVVLTDLEESLPLLERNVALNPALPPDLVKVKALDWNWPEERLLDVAGGPVDLVLGCDILAGVVAGAAHFAPILRLIRTLCDNGGMALLTATERVGIDVAQFANVYTKVLGGTRWRLDLLPSSMKEPAFDDGHTALLCIHQTSALAPFEDVSAWWHTEQDWVDVQPPNTYQLRFLDREEAPMWILSFDSKGETWLEISHLGLVASTLDCSRWFPIPSDVDPRRATSTFSRSRGRIRVVLPMLSMS